ncbi:MAG: hypothetical protein J5841_00815 [Clostridia bacterium]|nr:hypothetical protein [Clostridia bacterium]
MRRLAAVLLAAAMLAALPGIVCAETVPDNGDWFNTPTATPAPDAFRFREGIRWGMNQQQVQALESTKMTVQVKDNLSILRTDEKVAVSRFTADLIFMFRENRLLMISYEFRNMSGTDDFNYLSEALSSLYGVKTPAEPMKIKALMDVVNPYHYQTDQIRESGVWSAPDGTTIYLFYYAADAFAIMYVSPELGSRVYQTNGL